jgi:hypothetical protein
VAEPFTYRLDVAEQRGTWESLTLAQPRTSLDSRRPKDVARAVLERWILDHPGQVQGADRLKVFGDDFGDYPPDAVAHVRVWVFRGTPEEHEEKPAAAAYLVDDPDE